MRSRSSRRGRGSEGDHPSGLVDAVQSVAPSLVDAVQLPRLAGGQSYVWVIRAAQGALGKTPTVREAGVAAQAGGKINGHESVVPVSSVRRGAVILSVWGVTGLLTTQQMRSIISKLAAFGQSIPAREFMGSSRTTSVHSSWLTANSILTTDGTMVRNDGGIESVFLTSALGRCHRLRPASLTTFISWCLLTTLALSPNPAPLSCSAWGLA